MEGMRCERSPFPHRAQEQRTLKHLWGPRMVEELVPIVPRSGDTNTHSSAPSMVHAPKAAVVKCEPTLPSQLDHQRPVVIPIVDRRHADCWNHGPMLCHLLPSLQAVGATIVGIHDGSIYLYIYIYIYTHIYTPSLSFSSPGLPRST
jgi:hypothetical protein